MAALPQGSQMMEEEKSRSQKKRESTALQRMGEQLVGLSPTALETLRLPADLVVALEACRGMKTHEARRRQMQYIGRLMRELDAEDRLREALDALEGALRGRGAGRRRR